MTSLPPGVLAYNEANEKAKAAENFVALVFGGYKTGKTHWALRCPQPLRLVYMDNNPGLPAHLVRVAKEIGKDTVVVVEAVSGTSACAAMKDALEAINIVKKK